MKTLFQKIKIRNFKRIPYFFVKKPMFNIQQNNYALIGKLSTSLLHDILTPLTSLNMSTEIEEKNFSDSITPIIKDSVNQVREYVEIMKNFLTQTKKISRININEEIKKCLLLLKHKALSNNIQIQFLEFDQVQSRIHTLHIYQIIVNLLSNAIDASIKNKSNKVILIIKKEENNFYIECKDFGTGIPPHLMKRLWTYNFSTKSKDRGFGLYSVHHIVTHILKGQVNVQSGPRNGSLFSCVLPIRK